MKLVALGHKSRVGKDTLCRFMLSYLRQNTRDLNIQRLSFASALKADCYKSYKHLGLRDEAFYEKECNAQYRDIKLPKINKTPVEIWIEEGNKGREVYPYKWIDQLFLVEGVDIGIITDMRFPNEALACIENNGRLVRIDNPRAPIRDSVSDNALNEWTDWHEIFPNNGSLNELNEFAILLCKKYLL